MRLVLFEGPGAGRGIRPGVMTEAGVVDVSAVTAKLAAHSPQHLMEQIIDAFDELRPAFIIDVSARGEGRRTWRQGSWMGKSFDTFAPIGPCLTTADEIEDPNKLRVRFWNNGELYHDYVTDDMEHRVPELIEFASCIMTLYSGNVIACGTNHEGLGPLQDGEFCEIELERIGRMGVHVHDPLKRQWERSIYLGPGSTNPEAMRRDHQLGDARGGA